MSVKVARFYFPESGVTAKVPASHIKIFSAFELGGEPASRTCCLPALSSVLKILTQFSHGVTPDPP